MQRLQKMSNALNNGKVNDPSFDPTPVFNVSKPNGPLTIETKNAMAEAKQSAASFAKHLQDAATAYEAGATHSGATHRKLVTSIESMAAVISDCLMITETGRRQTAPVEKFQANLDRHKAEFVPKSCAVLSRCTTELAASLEKAKLHKQS